MALEVEVKARAGDLETVEKEIRGMGAKFLREGEQIDTYYNHPGRDFAKTDEALRIRREGERLSITYKGPKVDEFSKTREEIKLDIGNTVAMDAMLKKLGFKEVAEVRKHRMKFELDGLIITLDRVVGLGEFVEIEAVDDDLALHEVADVRDRILGLMDALDLKRRERLSYLELLHPELAGE